MNERQYQYPPFPGGQGGPPSGPPPFPGGPGQQQGGPGGQAGMQPPGPPPSYVPQAAQGFQSSGQPGTFAVDPGAIRPCLYRYVYIWLNNGQGFWAWLTFAGFRSVAGFRWNGFRWNYFGIDSNRISTFVCT